MAGEKIAPTALVRLHQPANPLPVVFDSPHSGHIYPDDFNHACDFALLEKIEDKYVDDLLSAAPEHGASLLCADFPRTYIDVNRARNDIDENLLERKWPSAQYGAISPTARSDAGIGLISRLIKPGIPIYNRKMGAEEVMRRIMTHYDPYHETLRRVLEAAYYAYGQYWYIDCHSMPSASAYPKRNVSLAGSSPQQSDIVLGDRDGQTCGRDFLYAFRDFWRSEGYRVSLNDPFKGVELVRRYAQPTRGKNTVQIEINRALYMDEATGEKRKDYADFKKKTEKMITFCTSFAKSKLNSMAAD